MKIAKNVTQIIGKTPLVHLKKIPEALEQYQAALEINPTSSEVKTNIELLIQQQNQGGQGENDQEKKDDKNDDKKNDQNKMISKVMVKIKKIIIHQVLNISRAPLKVSNYQKAM